MQNPPEIFISHPGTGEFIATGYADPDPLDADNWLVPANATLDAPPVTEAHQVAVLLDQQWKVLIDHRGPVYSIITGEERQHEQLGELPVGVTTSPRPSALHSWDGAQWRYDLPKVHEATTNEINRACELTITSGFWSSALGPLHSYSSQMDDQLNLTGVVLRGVDSLYACRDEQGVKAFRQHTAAQIRQVGDDFTLFKLTLLQKANTLKQQLDQALAESDLNALQAVSWDPVSA